MERLDKILANVGIGSRKEVKDIIKKGYIKIDGVVVKDNKIAIDPVKQIIFYKDEEIKWRKYIYLLMNKPDGVVSATFDNYDKTVIDMLSEEHKIFEPFPVGRLDKDTRGLLLITNDGDLNHKLISPKHHVPKVYYAKVNIPLKEEHIEAFNEGIVLDDGYKSLPGKLDILSSGEESTCHVTIYEGKFHQVKRMFKALQGEVVYLQRVSFGSINLDLDLKEGEYRELRDYELEILKNEGKGSK